MTDWQDNELRPKPWKVEVFRGMDGKYYAHVIARNNEITARSNKGYLSDDGLRTAMVNTVFSPSVKRASGGGYVASAGDQYDFFTSQVLKSQYYAQDVAETLGSLLGNTDW